MNRMEILEQLQRIVALTDFKIPEAMERAKGLILAFECPDEHAERHIDTPDELLDLLAGISSDPQVEGLSLSQKASTIALLHIAKALQQIAQDVKCLNENTCEGFDTVCIALQNVEPFHDQPSTHD